VLYTGGIAMLFLGLCYWAIDVMGLKRWAYPFKVFGMNALFVYVLSGLVAKMMYMIKLPAADGGTTSLQSLIYNHLYLELWSGKAASLAYAIGFVLSMYVANLVLYRNRIYIKV
jgi:predicted acyltransferase